MSDERLGEGLDHLQAAARELISAARAFLDVVEELVHDPHVVADAMSSVGSAVEAAARAARREHGDTAEPDEAGRVEHIRIS